MSIFLSEKVFSRTDNILYKAELAGNKIVSDLKLGKLNNDAIKELEDVFAKRFNLTSFKLKINKNSRWLKKRLKAKDKTRNTENNGLFYTIPSSKVIVETVFKDNYDKYFSINDDYSFKNKVHKITAFTNYESISGLENGGQLVAILLHELGHNYYEFSATMMVGYTFASFYNLILTVISIPFNILKMFLDSFLDIIKWILGRGTIYSLINSLSITPIKIILQILNLPLNITLVTICQSHKQEEFADYFVSVNGYGSYLGDSFFIFYKDRNEKDASSNILVKSINTIDNLSLIMFSLFYVHPELSIRIDNQITNLNNELAYAEDESEKEFIKEEINALKKIKDKFDNEKLKSQLINLTPINSQIESVKSNTIFYGTNFEELRSKLIKRG